VKPFGWLGLALPLALGACPAPHSDPPPPPRKAEIPSAPPRALGALAGGTDAAPRPDAASPGSELSPGLPLPAPGGLGPKRAAPTPSAEPEGSEEGAAPGPPDAGMAL
jgi:hypothetical protein